MKFTLHNPKKKPCISCYVTRSKNIISKPNKRYPYCNTPGYKLDHVATFS